MGRRDHARPNKRGTTQISGRNAADVIPEEVYMVVSRWAVDERGGKGPSVMDDTLFGKVRLTENRPVV